MPGDAEARPGTAARSVGCLRQRGVLRGKLAGDMAVLVLAQRLAQHGENGSGSGPGILIGHGRGLAHLRDEVLEVDRVCPWPATPPCLQLLCQVGQIRGKASRVAVAELVCESPRTARLISAGSSRDNPVRSAAARMSPFWSMATTPFAGLPAGIPGHRAWPAPGVTSAKAGRDTACPDGLEAHLGYLLSAAGRCCTASRVRSRLAIGTPEKVPQNDQI